MNKMWIIVKEVYRKNVKSGAFIMMVFGPLLMFGIIGLISYFIGTSREANSVGIIGVVDAPLAIQTVLDDNEIGNDYRYFNSQDEATQALINDEVNGYLVFESNTQELTATYYRERTSRDIDVSKIQQVLQQYQSTMRLQDAGIDQSILSKIEADRILIPTINLSTSSTGEVTEVNEDEEARFIRTGIAYVVCFVVYMFVMTYVGIISQEIATEKGSRIMEIVLSSISATKHFFGKMIGIGLVILTQLLIYVILFMIARFVLQQSNFGELLKELPVNINEVLSQSGKDIALGGLYSVAGILIYTSLAGFLGSLVSKIEDVNKMVTPLVLLGVVGLYIGMYALSSTNNLIVRIGSHIPFFTPFVMPFRIAADTVSGTEIWISVIISLVFMIACLVVSAVFYKSNVLVTSDKGMIQTFKRSYQLWKSERE